jgi:hypothetical protein
VLVVVGFDVELNIDRRSWTADTVCTEEEHFITKMRDNGEHVCDDKMMMIVSW